MPPFSILSMVPTKAFPSKGHFRVTKKNSSLLGVEIIDILQNVVLVRTNAGPRFMSRKWFDTIELNERFQRAQECMVRPIDYRSWQVVHENLPQVVSMAAIGTKDEHLQCSCADAYFQHERGIPHNEVRCKHIIAVMNQQAFVSNV
jgi:hypothetical protein